MDNRLFVTQAQLQKLVADRIALVPPAPPKRRVKWPGGWKPAPPPARQPVPLRRRQ